MVMKDHENLIVRRMTGRDTIVDKLIDRMAAAAGFRNDEEIRDQFLIGVVYLRQRRHRKGLKTK